MPGQAAVRRARRRCVWESVPQCCRTAVRSSGPRGPLAFTIVYRGEAATSWESVTPVTARRCKIKATPRGASLPMCSCGKHHASVSFAADQGALIPYGTGHVRLPNWSPDEAGTPRPRGILNHQTGGQIDHNGRDCRRTDASVQHSRHGKRQGVILPDRSSGFIHQREPIHVRIYGQADRRPGLP